MPNISDMNIILGQGSAIKQMRTTTEQDVELSRQLIAQASGKLQKKDKIRVKNIEATYKTEIEADDKKKILVSPANEQVLPPENHKVTNTSGGIFVDIKV